VLWCDIQERLTNLNSRKNSEAQYFLYRELCNKGYLRSITGTVLLVFSDVC
jgi:hypothetical protein